MTNQGADAQPPAPRRWRRIASAMVVLGAAGLAAIWLWPGVPFVFRELYSVALLVALLVVGLVAVAVCWRGPIRWAAVTVGLAGLAGGVWLVEYGNPFGPAPPPPQDPPPLIDFSHWSCDRESRPVPALAPGTMVGDGPPEGWSHLLFKVKPRSRPGSESTAPAFVLNLSNRFFLAAAARVKEQPGAKGPRHVLEAVGIGVGAETKEGDRVSSSREAKPPPELAGFLVRTALGQLETDTSPSLCVARTPNLWIWDTPMKVKQDGATGTILRRFAVWVNPRSGEVTALFWELAQGDWAGSPANREKVFRLPPALVEEVPLVVSEGEGRGFVLSLARRPSSTEFPLDLPWRERLNDRELEEQTVRLLEEELARRASGAP